MNFVNFCAINRNYWAEIYIFKSILHTLPNGQFLKTTFLSSVLILVVSLIHPGQWEAQSSRNASAGENTLGDYISRKYESLHEPSLNQDAFQVAMLGFRALCVKGLVTKDSLITIIDYSLPSSENRFFIINLNRSKVICKTLVSHGRNSGELYASRFSDKPQSHQSALGFYLTGDPYFGSQGYSLKLAGIDTGYNDHALIRSVVIHGADYVTPQYVNRYGRLGRSFGCPALPPALTAEIIDCIKEGSVLFSYYPDKAYLNNSKVLGSLSVTQPVANLLP